MADAAFLIRASTNVIIYGHNMKNDTMFSVLLEYQDKEWYEQHKRITFNTIYGDATYEVAAVILSRHSTKVRRASAIMAWWMRLIRRNLMTIWRISGVCSFMIQGWRSAMATV